MYLDELLKLLKETNAEYHEIIVFRWCDLIDGYVDFFTTDDISDAIIDILAKDVYKVNEVYMSRIEDFTNKTIRIYCKEI